ncbi:hypothetical protein PHLGIDRAFT_262886 [Phlebiopsis gigantea 11061_1 CR5-6]|uniref:Uncharacterized protein n=1 Tax=Phlebiopsis gigantea (strain 11061_1 CR5-6) TaxID=745531 RepID=A0A0C3PX04_PHLG1|nr:hypothetical protein PHLGIDRAFT_262886 [Phlebiopsis gigantea 11061_1 CR5-6]
MMHTSDQIARREPSGRNVAGSVVNQKSISTPLGRKALRLDCILLDPPRHKRGNNPPQMKVPCRQSPSTSVAPRLRCHEARNTTTQTSTPRTSNESHGASQIAIASRKRRASSPPYAWGPIARRDRQHNTSSTGPSERRLSTQTPGVGPLAPDRFSVLEHAHGDLGLGIDALNWGSISPDPQARVASTQPQTLRTCRATVLRKRGRVPDC